MKRTLLHSLAVATVILLAFTVWGAHATEPAPDQQSHPACLHCGMDRTQFAHSRVFVVYDDGTSVGTCSLHCAAIDLSLNIDKTPVVFQVADYNSRLLVDAESAHWVTGGAKMGVMTRRAKWAFSGEAGAQAFVSANGGAVTAFSNTIKAAYEDMYDDVRMIRAKRLKMKKARES